MTTTMKQHPAGDRLQSIGSAIALLSRKIRPDRNGRMLDEEKAQASKHELLKGWDPDKAGESDTKARLEKLVADRTTAEEELATAAATDTSGDEAAVKELKAAQDAHGKMSDDELNAAIQKAFKDIDDMHAKMKPLCIEQQRRRAVKDLSEKLNVKTSMDRAILDLVLNPGTVPTKTKINPPK
jgi:hypothetical protein